MEELGVVNKPECIYNVDEKDVIYAFKNNISCTRGLNKCWLETLPSLLGRVSLRGADSMASCKKLLHLHT